jgi:molybdopterin-guanine dinucleotide biosynthesis protein A
MLTDKAALEYQGKPQLERAYELLDACCERTFVSVRRDQGADALRAMFPQIVDLQDDLGPMAGIAAAQARFPSVAWLVLACDLPLGEPPARASQ